MEKTQNSPQTIYRKLQERFTSIHKIRNIKPCDNGESMISLKEQDFPISPYSETLDLSTGSDLFVREAVSKRLSMAQEFLRASHNNKYQLIVTYAYRQPTIQEDKFVRILTEQIKSNPEGSAENWINDTHRFVACPDIAGHPSGGAVDVLIANTLNGEPIDMGTKTHTLSEDSYVFSPFISKNARENRMLLRSAMTRAGFVPFDGEWWHFSYGDREWAAVRGKRESLYNQIAFDHETKEVRRYITPSDQDLIKKALRALKP